MAKNTVEIVVEADTKKAEKGLSNLGKSLGGLGDIAKNAIGFAMGGALLQLPGMLANAASGVVEFIDDAATLQGVGKTFDQLAMSIGTTADALMVDLREATAGTIADADLMAAGNKFMSMGLANTGEEAAKLAQVATQLGTAMGEDATASMENFALMMANQSIPRLDSFGISSGKVRERIEELMEGTEGLTREQAFNQAVMEEAEKTMAKVGDQTGGTRASIDRIKSTFQNLKDTLGQALIPAVEQVLGVFSTMISDTGPKLQEIIKKGGEQFAMWVRDILPKVVSWFRDKLVPTIRDEVIPAALQIIAWIRDEAVPWIKEQLIPAIKDLVEWFKTTWQQFEDAYNRIKTTIDQLKFIFENLWDYFKVVGGRIVDNIRSGIENAWNSFMDWIKQKAQDIIGGILGALGFGSPSKPLMDIGRGLMESMAKGMGEGLEMPITAAAQMGSAVTGAAAAGIQRHDHWNLTINTQAQAEDVAYSYDMMRAMAGA